MNNEPNITSETPAEMRKRLRAQAKAARKALSAEERKQKSHTICQKLAAQLDSYLAESESKPYVVAVYSAFPWEVNLAEFIEHAYQHGCTVAFPCMMEDAHGIPDAPGRGMREPGSDPSAQHITQQTMEMRAVRSEAFRTNSVPFLNDPLKDYRHESADLADMPYIPANELEFLVVPAVGFDEAGNRHQTGKMSRVKPASKRDCPFWTPHSFPSCFLLPTPPPTRLKAHYNKENGTRRG